LHTIPPDPIRYRLPPRIALALMSPKTSPTMQTVRDQFQKENAMKLLLFAGIAVLLCINPLDAKPKKPACSGIHLCSQSTFNNVPEKQMRACMNKATNWIGCNCSGQVVGCCSGPEGAEVTICDDLSLTHAPARTPTAPVLPGSRSR
jgi:hypothetical protein